MPSTRWIPLFWALSFLATAAAAHAAAPLRTSVSPGQAGPPALHARSAILIEAFTGAVLYESHADEPIPPASLTKLMTLHLALQAIEEGRMSPSEVLVPGPDAWARNMPPRSSVMFLGPNQKLTVSQLLRGLVVDSGNDAAVEVADRIAGSVPAFVGMMNREAARLGYHVMHFVEPAGVSPANSITAREYADFARGFVLSHPDALKDLFSVREFTYPLEENLTAGNREKPVTQSNRNLLLGKYEGADGLKTGYLDESGYNIAVTAERAGMRLISVILGVPDVGPVSGTVLRAVESAALLDYGFSTFVTVRAAYDKPAAVHVWKGRSREVGLRASPAPIVAVRKDQASSVRTEIQQTLDVEAPVKTGQVLGVVVVSVGGRALARFPLRAEAGVDRGGFLRGALDTIILLLRGIHAERLTDAAPPA
ncbi:MAG: D-alanyl-D-alanine carboxypeptidase family protein [Spirochaetia bacterium]|jgi:D-alanyl-D-alanine carboxypeptidase (penicillin-binding protein 5/6)